MTELVDKSGILPIFGKSHILTFLMLPKVKTETELVKELKDGFTSAYDELFNTYGNRVYKFAFSILKSREDSEEIVQDTFFKIWEKRRTIDHEQSFKSFLFTIAYNNIMTKFREKAKEKKYREYFITNASDHYDQEESILFDDIQNQVQKIIDRLPPRRKQIFILRKENNLTYKEIAGKLGISSKTVENNINLAIKYIKTQIGKDSLIILLYISLFL